MVLTKEVMQTIAPKWVGHIGFVVMQKSAQKAATAPAVMYYIVLYQWHC